MADLELHPLLTVEGAVTEEDARLDGSQYHTFISRFKEHEG